MIIHLKPEVNKEKAEELGKELSAIVLPRNGFFALITPNKLKAVEEKHKSFVSESFPFDDDMQLASKKYMSSVREIKIADGLSIGGNTNNTIIITKLYLNAGGLIFKLITLKYLLKYLKIK